MLGTAAASLFAKETTDGPHDPRSSRIGPLGPTGHKGGPLHHQAARKSRAPAGACRPFGEEAALARPHVQGIRARNGTAGSRGTRLALPARRRFRDRDGRVPINPFSRRSRISSTIFSRNISGGRRRSSPIRPGASPACAPPSRCGRSSPSSACRACLPCCRSRRSAPRSRRTAPRTRLGSTRRLSASSPSSNGMRRHLAAKRNEGTPY